MYSINCVDDTINDATNDTINDATNAIDDDTNAIDDDTNAIDDDTNAIAAIVLSINVYLHQRTIKIPDGSLPPVVPVP